MLLGLTGGIATGKSTFVRLLRERARFTFFDADACVHELLASDPGVIAAVRQEFALPGPKIERAVLREIVFRNQVARHRLEKILHPVVRARWQAMAQDCRRQRLPFLADIPLLLETAAASFFDAVILVAASPEIQRSRLELRGIDPGLIDGMLASQWPIGQKMSLADHVIWNDGSSAELARQCALLLESLFPTRHE